MTSLAAMVPKPGAAPSLRGDRPRGTPSGWTPRRPRAPPIGSRPHVGPHAMGDGRARAQFLSGWRRYTTSREAGERPHVDKVRIPWERRPPSTPGPKLGCPSCARSFPVGGDTPLTACPECIMVIGDQKGYGVPLIASNLKPVRVPSITVVEPDEEYSETQRAACLAVCDAPIVAGRVRHAAAAQGFGLPWVVPRSEETLDQWVLLAGPSGLCPRDATRYWELQAELAAYHDRRYDHDNVGSPDRDFHDPNDHEYT
jgi:hypothetical protein